VEPNLTYARAYFRVIVVSYKPSETKHNGPTSPVGRWGRRYTSAADDTVFIIAVRAASYVRVRIRSVSENRERL